MTRAGTTTRAGSRRQRPPGHGQRARAGAASVAVPGTGSRGRRASSRPRRHAGSEPVAHEVEERGGRGRRARSPRQAVMADGHDGPLGRLEGHLGEAGGGEVGPDGGRGVGGAAVPGPDDVAARRAERRQRLDGGRDVAAADVAEDPAHQHEVGRHVVGVPAARGRRRPRRSAPGRPTPAGAGPRPGEGDQAGSSSTSSADTSPRLGMGRRRRRSRRDPGRRTGSRSGSARRGRAGPRRARGAPWTARVRSRSDRLRRRVLVGRRASAPSASASDVSRRRQARRTSDGPRAPWRPIVGWVPVTAP